MSRVIRWAVILSALATFVFAAPAPVPALAAVGDLTQPAGSLGCVENDPSSNGDPCAASTFGEGLSGAQYVQAFGTNPYVMSYFGIEVLQRDASDPGPQDLQCLDGDGSDLGNHPSCLAQSMMAGSSFAGGSIRVSPDGKWVFVDDYTQNAAGNQLIVFARNQTTGELSQASCYSDNGNNANGAALCSTLKPNVGNDYDAGSHLAVSPNGKWLYTDNGYVITVFQINDSTGALTASSCASEPSVAGCPDNFPADANSNAGEMVVSPDSKFLYFSARNGPEVQWLSIDQSTGELVNTGSANAENCIQDLSGLNSGGCVATM